MEEYEGKDFVIALVPRNLEADIRGHECLAVDGTFKVESSGQYQLVWVLSKSPQGVSYPVACCIVNNEKGRWHAKRVWECVRALMGTWRPRYMLTDQASNWIVEASDVWKSESPDDHEIKWLTCLYHALDASQKKLGDLKVPGAAGTEILHDISVLADCGSGTIFDAALEVVIDSWTTRWVCDPVRKYAKYFRQEWGGKHRFWFWGASPCGIPRASPVEIWHKHTKADINPSASARFLLASLTRRHFLNVLDRVKTLNTEKLKPVRVPQEWVTEAAAMPLLMAGGLAYRFKRCGNGRYPKCTPADEERYVSNTACH